MRDKCIYCGADLPLPEELTVHLCPEMNDFFKQYAQRTDDAYWLRRYAGMAMQNLLDRHYDPLDNVGYRVSKCLGRECAEIAVSLLDEIKKHEEKNATNSK